MGDGEEKSAGLDADGERPRCRLGHVAGATAGRSYRASGLVQRPCSGAVAKRGRQSAARPPPTVACNRKLAVTSQRVGSYAGRPKVRFLLAPFVYLLHLTNPAFQRCYLTRSR